MEHIRDTMRMEGHHECGHLQLSAEIPRHQLWHTVYESRPPTAPRHRTNMRRAMLFWMCLMMCTPLRSYNIIDLHKQLLIILWRVLISPDLLELLFFLDFMV